MSYACFVSYRDPGHPRMRRMIGEFADALQFHLSRDLPGVKVYWAEDGLGPGDLYNEQLASELCQSSSLVMLYNGEYFDRAKPYCAREYQGMVQLERRRRAVLSQVGNHRGMIFPVIWSGTKEDLPAEIRGRRHCAVLSDIRLVPGWSRRRDSYDRLRELADRIVPLHQAMRRAGAAPVPCEQFNLPTETQVRAMLARFEAARSQVPRPMGLVV
jgi:hypothetical protein